VVVGLEPLIGRSNAVFKADGRLPTQGFNARNIEQRTWSSVWFRGIPINSYFKPNYALD
jgi:hypothetical protein